MAERVFTMCKPDAFRRGLIGKVFCRLEAKGLQLVGVKLVSPTRALMEKHYGATDAGEPWYQDLIDFVTSGPLLAMVWQGEEAIAAANQVIGDALPLESQAGTIRGEYALNRIETVVHRAKTVEESEKQIKLWFEGNGSLFKAADLLPPERVKEQAMAQDNPIPQHPSNPTTDRGEQPIQPTGFNYVVLPQPEHLRQPFRQISGQPVMPSRQIHAIYPDREQEF